jgi:hypothetical protein
MPVKARGIAGPAHVPELLAEDDREFVAERVAIMTADGIPERLATGIARQRMQATRKLRRELLVASVWRSTP